MTTSFAEALKAKTAYTQAMAGGAEGVAVIKEEAHRKAILAGYIVGVGVGYLDSAHEDRGAALVLYTTKGLTCKDAEALSGSVTIGQKADQRTVSVRVERAGEFFANNSESVTERRVAETATASPRRETAARSVIEGAAYLDGEYRKRVRPVPGGYSVGTPNWSGTAGLIVINDPAHTQLYILSNNHVLNKDNSTGYTEDIQPGGADGGISGHDTIGRLDRFIMLSKTADNYLDAATCIPLSNNLLDPRYGRSRLVIPGHYLQFSVGWRLFKAGRTTEDVFGTVDSVHTDVSINYGGYAGLGTIKFKDQSVIKKVDLPVSLPGDSGSVWIKADDHYACAVNYAGPADGSYSIAFPINWFMTAFKCLVAIPNRFAEIRKAKAKDDAMLSTAVTEQFQELLESLVQKAQ